jgi:hypothetical protein
MSNIFVNMAAYRDFELTPTVVNAIENSSGKHKINFGIHMSYLEESEINIPNLSNVKYTTSKVPENIGVGMGRYLAHQFYNEEDFYFQCDSHSRFFKNWDQIAINSILKYQIEGIQKPLLTMYPGNYWYKNNDFIEIEFDMSNPKDTTTISFHEKPEDFKLLRIPSQTAIASRNSIFTKSVSGGSIFTLGPFISPNKEMAFWGEEIMTAARAYTHGYDLMLPDQQYLYHLYYNHKNPEINRRKIVWEDFPEQFEKINNKARGIVYKTFTENIVGDGYLGTERTLSEYELFSGLNFTSGEIFENC